MAAVDTDRGGAAMTGTRKLFGVGLLAAVVLTGCNLGAKPVISEVSGTVVLSTDLDGDGNVDLFAGGFDGYRVLLGDGTGAFSLFHHEPGLAIVDADLGDVDGDGVSDVFVTVDGNSDFAQNTYLLLGTGSGEFGTPSPVGEGTSLGGRVDEVGLADVTGDGHADALEATLFVSSDDALVVRPGDGSGGFGAPVHHRIQPDFSSSALVVRDLNEDGRPDVVVGGLGWDTNGNQGFVAVFVNDGAGGFGPVGLHPTDDDSTNPIDIAIDDLDGDGDLDMVTGNFSNNLSLFRGDGIGGFAPQEAIPVEGETAGIDVGDLDGDGRSDITYSIWGPQSAVLFGNGGGTFGDRHPIGSAGGFPVDAIVQDLDHDGRSDVILVNSEGTAVLMNRLDGRPNH
jgi:hypothetical protein